MPKSAVLLMDLQRDFLNVAGGRTPVEASDAKAVLQVASEVLTKSILVDALPVFVMNQFPVTARIGNSFSMEPLLSEAPAQSLMSAFSVRARKK